ncbi:enoyl-CoA hydratase/isomerase family protein [Streptomyces sedi]|nr:enoyl-CoA hydratase/isomerase family protein [Streptomyces sedi]
MNDPAPVTLTVTEPLARLTLDRPAHGNALSYAAMLALIEALERAHAADPPVLLLTGAGQDLTVGREKAERVPGVSRQENLRLILRANELLRTFPGITVAAVRGRALGFGTGLALHSDLAIAADTAVLGFDELAAGLPPLVVLTYLYRHVHPKAADELVLTGRRLGAAEALNLGLLSRVVAEADLDAVVERTVAELGARSPSALRLLKEFAGRAKSHRPPDPEEFGEHAVARLVEWIENGERS